MEKSFRLFSTFDWIVGAICLIAGLWMRDAWFIGSGALALVFAYLKPAQAIHRHLKKKLLRQTDSQAATNAAAASMAEDAFYREVLGGQALATPADVAAEHPPGTAPARATPSYGSTLLAYGPMLISRNRHNKLRAVALNLANRGQDASSAGAGTETAPRFW